MNTMKTPTVSQSRKPLSAGTPGNGGPGQLQPPRKANTARRLGTTHSESAAEARSRQLIAAMVAFRDGDFSVRLPADWAGTDGRIAEAFNQALAHEERISREVLRLSVSVGKEGRLKQRMSV